jgi:putative transposase
MDFVANQLSGGAKFRVLAVADALTMESLAIAVAKSLRGEHLVSTPNRIAIWLSAPKYLSIHNGGEFSGRLPDIWAYHNRAKVDFSRPSTPTDECQVVKCNGSSRNACLNLH